MNYLPINQSILNTHTADCWAYYCYLYKTITHTYMNFTNTITINISIDAAKSRYGRAYADLSQPMWSKYSKTWEQDRILIIDTPTTMMPLEVFDRAHEAILTAPSRSRTGLMRLYLYMYYKCHQYNNDFGISIERLIAELTGNSRDLCAKLKFLMDAGLIRRMGKYNPDLGVPYRYFIPIELCSGLNKI
jgi:hypothetical protein